MNLSNADTKSTEPSARIIEVSVLERYPYYRGHRYDVILMTPVLVVCTSAILGAKNNRCRFYKNSILFPKDVNFIVLSTNMVDM